MEREQIRVEWAEGKRVRDEEVDAAQKALSLAARALDDEAHAAATEQMAAAKEKWRLTKERLLTEEAQLPRLDDAGPLGAEDDG